MMARVILEKGRRTIAEARDAAAQVKHWDASAKKLKAEYDDPNYRPIKPSSENISLRREWQMKATNCT